MAAHKVALAFGAAIAPLIFASASTALAATSADEPAQARLTIEGMVLFSPSGVALYRDSRENTASPTFKLACTGTVDRTTDDQQSGIGPRPEIGFKLLKSCLDKFRPYLATAAATAGSQFGTFKRPDGTLQWTYRGFPLYTSIKDRGAGQLNGVNPGFGGFRRGGMGFAAADMPLPVGFKLSRTAEGLVLASADTERPVYTPRNGARLQAASVGREDFKPIPAPALARRNGDWSVVDNGLGVKQYAFQGKPLYSAAVSLNELEIDSAKNWEPVVLFKAPPLPTAIGTRLTLAGDVYTDKRGRTLYTYTCNSGRFAPGAVSVPCDDRGDPAAFMVALCGDGQECARRWKPYFAPANARPIGEFSVVDITYPMFTDQRGELYPASAPKVKAWAYRGRPLFTYYEDEKPGDIWGNDVGGIWGSIFTAVQVPGKSATFFEP